DLMQERLAPLAIALLRLLPEQVVDVRIPAGRVRRRADDEVLERRADARRLGRIEEGRRDRGVEGDGQLAFGLTLRRDRAGPCRDDERSEEDSYHHHGLAVFRGALAARQRYHAAAER